MIFNVSGGGSVLPKDGAAGQVLTKTATGTAWAKAPGQPRNLLDNSDFRNPVNQRGQTSYAVSGYTIDRWCLGSGSLTINSNSISINNGFLVQYIEHLDTTKEYTLAYCNNGVIAVQSNPIRTDLSSYPAIVLDTGWMNLDNVQWAALYEGEYTAETLPEYQSKGYGAELAECQRYANLLEVSAYCRVGLCKSSVGEAASILFADTPAMRSGAVPSVYLISGNWGYLHTEFGDQAVTSIAGFGYQVGTKHSLLVYLSGNNPTQTIEPLINASENVVRILISLDL